MAESNEPFCESFAQYLKENSRNRRIVAGIPWQERERLFEARNAICRRKRFAGFILKNVSIRAMNVTFSVEEERLGMKSLEGRKAPAFSLEGHDGKTHSLDDYRGQKVILFFYPKDSTPG